MESVKTTAFVAASMLLSACGGGGGGGGTVPAFTSWSAIQPGSTFAAKGLSQEATYTYDSNGERVIDVGIASSVSTTSTATMTFDSAGDLSRLTLLTPTSRIDLSVFVDLGEGAIVAANSADPNLITSVALIADPYYLGYEYQSFGIWETQVATTGTVGGVFSTGAPTAGSAIPTTGSASFAGNLAGSYIDPDGLVWFAFADLNVDVNFAARTLDFNSELTSITDLLTPDIPRSDLDLTGTLTYQPGINTFTGPVTSGVTGLVGTSTGQFYGPSAQELGGVFLLRGDGVESYGGAYGAVQVPAP